MIETTTGQAHFSLRAAVFAVAAFLAVTGLMLLAVEWVGVERIQAAVEAAGPTAPLAYVALKTATYVFAPLSSGPIQMSAGLLFGLWPGVFYTLLGEVLGGSISFLIARQFGRRVVLRFVGGQQGIQQVDDFAAQLGGWRALVYARLFLFALYDFISYAAGFTSTIRFYQYVLVSVIAGFVPTFLGVAMGAALAEDRSHVILVYVGVGVLSLIPLAFSFYMQRRKRRRKHVLL